VLLCQGGYGVTVDLRDTDRPPYALAKLRPPSGRPALGPTHRDPADLAAGVAGGGGRGGR